MKLSDLAHLPLTYELRGLTLDGPMPPGFHHLEVERRLGAGDATYARAAEGVLRWAPQRGIGLRPLTTVPRAVEGAEILSRLLVLPLPCRVMWTVEGPERTGFGYGTLRGHLESGEEGFLVERRGEQVYAVIRAYSVAARLPARLGGPISWQLQKVAAQGYLRALQRAADGTTS